MFSTLVTVLLMLVYFALSSGGMKYELTSKEIAVNLGLFKKKIEYSRIVDIDIVDLKLLIRLFGASLPGFHWGLFKTSVGNAHVYATKISGQFILITLVDGEKIALSPERLDQLSEAIKEKTTLIRDRKTEKLDQQEKSINKLLYLQVLAVTIAYAIFLIDFLRVYTSLPEIVPVHFGFDGIANRFAHKSELFWLAGTATIFPVINAILTLKFGKCERVFVLFLGAAFIAVMGLFIYIINAVIAAAV
jgi:hypothetical protein